MDVLSLFDPQTGQVFHCPQGQLLQVGRKDPASVPDIACADQHVSRRHCQLIALPGGRIKVLDQSTYGTFLNGQRIQGQTVARPGDRLVLGHNYELRVRATDPQAATFAASSGRQHHAAPTPGVSPTAGRVGDGLPGNIPAMLAGRYRMEEELGRGGMGVVFKATDMQAGRQVAVKFLFAGDEEESAERFKREARLAAQLGDYPAIVKVTDHGSLDDGQGLYLVMDYVDGVSMAQLARGGVDPLLACKLVARTARAVAYAHDRNVVHRDLKPANVLVTRADQQIRLTDFGIAKEDGSGLTVTGIAMGSPNFMAPEQIEDVKRAGPKADIYGLGGLLYALLTGRPPFKGKGLGDTLRKVQSGQLTPPSEIVAGIAPELEGIVKRALSLKPEDRHDSATALAHELEDWWKRNRGSTSSVRLQPPN